MFALWIAACFLLAHFSAPWWVWVLFLLASVIRFAEEVAS